MCASVKVSTDITYYYSRTDQYIGITFNDTGRKLKFPQDGLFVAMYQFGNNDIGHAVPMIGKSFDFLTDLADTYHDPPLYISFMFPFPRDISPEDYM